MANLTRRLPLGGLIVLSLVTAAPAVAAPTVSVRIEGSTRTLLEQTSVTLDSTPTPAPGNCPGNTAAAAIEKATAGNWDRKAFAQTILGESHAFANNDYWGEWVSEKYGGGICSDVLAEGDRVVMLVDVADPVTYDSTVFPLTLTGAPAKVSPGTPFTVDVKRYKPVGGNPGTGVPEPATGAVITGGGATTGADGKATITLTTPGEATLKASVDGSRSAAVKVCVTDGSDGFCGTTKSGAQSPAASAPCTTRGDDGLCGTKDTRPPGGSIRSIGEQQRFAAGKGPRTLSGDVTDAQGVRKVRLRLTRNDNGRCASFDGKLERFKAIKRCGAARGEWFDAATSGTWSYLLPAALTRGRYVLDMSSTDAAGNVDTRLERGRNRIVFHVA